MPRTDHLKKQARRRQRARSELFVGVLEVPEPEDVAIDSFPSCSPPSAASQGLEEMSGVTTPKRPLYPIFEASDDAVDEDVVEDVAQHVEKKRRLSVEQVKSLEKYFELENKLEPERKLQLARELGLQPRQVAVWFQNRRARWKTKQLEKDYDALKSSLDTLKCDYQSLLEEKQQLETEVERLNRILNRRGSKLEAEEDEAAVVLLPHLVKVKFEDEQELCTKEEESSNLRACKKDCSSSDSDDSEILDEESPRNNKDKETSFSLQLEQHEQNHEQQRQQQQVQLQQQQGDVPEADPLDCHLTAEEESYERLFHSYTRVPKLEDGGSFNYDVGSGFMAFEDQDHGWWEWP